MKELYCWLAVLCMLVSLHAAALADETETIITEADIAALQAEVDALLAEIAQAEAELAALEKQYAYENRDRDVIFPQEHYILLSGAVLKLTPEITPLKDTAPVETKLVWETSDRSVARVDGLGRVTGVNAGTAVITCIATDNADISASVTVEVVRPVRKVELAESIVTLTLSRKDGVLVGQTAQANASVAPADAYDPSLSWKSEDESVVTVEDGMITAVGLGSARVTVTANDGSGAQDVMRVYVVQGAESIMLSHTDATVVTGTTLQLRAQVLPDNTENDDVVWSSGDEAIATVTKNGLVTAIAPGECTIYATTADGTELRAECCITAVRLAERIMPDVTVVNLKKGEAAAPVFTVYPADTSDKTLSFTSSNEAVAVVDENGVITPVDGGSCIVTARANDGSGAWATITVNVEPDIPLEIIEADVRYTLTGTPCAALTVRNGSFDTDITGFTFAVECRDAYYGVLTPAEGDGTYAWSEAIIIPGDTWASETWSVAMPGCEMVWQAEMWLTSVTTAEGEEIPVPEEERIVLRWTKY